MLAAGLLTPLASTMLSSVMVTAIRKVHLKTGAWSTNGGYEYNAVLIATLFALTKLGPGKHAVDARAFPRLRGPRLAVAELAGALAASEIVTSSSSPSMPRSRGKPRRHHRGRGCPRGSASQWRPRRRPLVWTR